MVNADGPCGRLTGRAGPDGLLVPTFSAEIRNRTSFGFAQEDGAQSIVVSHPSSNKALEGWGTRVNGESYANKMHIGVAAGKFLPVSASTPVSGLRANTLIQPEF